MRRGAFTLIELCLVLAVLVMLTAIAWPAFDVLMNNRQLRAAADQLRAAWTSARVEAQTTGQIYQFRCEPNGRGYEISVYSAQTYDETIASVSEAEADAERSGVSARVGAGVPIGPQELPEGVTFRAVRLQDDGRDAPQLTGNAALADQQSGLSVPILFYADGTTSSASCAIADERELFVLLVLRGLTGVVTVSDPLSEEELP